ncbi:uncharacterized protein DS421_13g419390 [Arachis hypogaea]|nr:uncharacterized protein DS421_13g419390 [Arachis hypogaea]
MARINKHKYRINKLNTESTNYKHSISNFFLLNFHYNLIIIYKQFTNEGEDIFGAIVEGDQFFVGESKGGGEARAIADLRNHEGVLEGTIEEDLGRKSIEESGYQKRW